MWIRTLHAETKDKFISNKIFNATNWNIHMFIKTGLFINTFNWWLIIEILEYIFFSFFIGSFHTTQSTTISLFTHFCLTRNIWWYQSFLLVAFSFFHYTIISPRVIVRPVLRVVIRLLFVFFFMYYWVIILAIPCYMFFLC